MPCVGYLAKLVFLSELGSFTDAVCAAIVANFVRSFELFSLVYAMYQLFR